MKRRDPFHTTILAVWLAWLTACLIIDGYQLVSGGKRLDWSSVAIVVVFLIFALGVAFLMGRSVEREAMREKIRVIIRSGRLPVVEPHPLDNPTLIRINEPLTEAQEADFKAKWKAAQAGPMAVLDTDEDEAKFKANRRTPMGVIDFATTMAEVVERETTIARARLGLPTGPGEYDKHFPKPGQ